MNTKTQNEKPLASLLLLMILIGYGLQSCKKETEKTTNLNITKPNSQIPSDSIGDPADSIKQDKTRTEQSDEEIKKEQEKQNREREQIVKKYTIDKKGNGLVYQIFCEVQKDGIINFRKIKISKSGKLIQKINLPKDSSYVYNDYEIDFASDKDWNFDKKNDIVLINWHGMVDRTYYLWLYDKNSGKYNFCPSFSKIMNPGLDQKKKEIVSEYHIGPTEFHYEKYQWKKGKYVLTHSEVEGGDYE